MSWPEVFASDYDERTARMVGDIPFYVALAVQAVGPIVELAVGTGRVAVPVAQATGRQVIGIDASPAMLAHARDRAAAAGVDLRLVGADMRDLEFGRAGRADLLPFPVAVASADVG